MTGLLSFTVYVLRILRDVTFSLARVTELVRTCCARADLSAASVVTVYQSTEINNKIKEKLLRELCPGTRVISYSFIFDGWEPVKVDESAKLYLYEIKPKK